MIDLGLQTPVLDDHVPSRLGLTAMDGWVVGVSSALVVAVAGFRLGVPSLWYDETFSVIVADGDLLHLLRMSAETEASGALYYLLLGMWLSLGTSEWVLRSLSVLIAVATIPVFHLLARELTGALAARIATVLLAVNAMFITYARELRGYGLALLLVTVSALALVRALRGHRHALAWWALWALAGGLSAYAHLFGVLVVASQIVLFPLVVRDREQWRPALVATAAVAVLLVPMSLFLVTNTGEQIDWVPPLALGSFLWLARELVGAPLQGPAANLLLVPAAVFGAVGAYHVVRRTWTGWRSGAADRELLLVSWVLVPVVAAAAASVLIQPVFMPRYFIVVLPALMLLIGSGIACLRRWPLLMFAAAAATAASGAVTISALYDDAGRQDWRRAVSIVAENWQEGDAILISPHHYLPAVDYYADRSSLSSRGPVDVYVDRELGAYRGRDHVVVLRVGDLAMIEEPRIWYLTVAGGPRELTNDGSDGTVAGSATDGWTVLESRSTRGLEVRLLGAAAADEGASS